MTLTIPKHYKVMLVEDDELDREQVLRLLKKNDINIDLIFASDGHEALMKLQGNKAVPKDEPLPNLIVLDINIPKINGLELLKLIREDEALAGIPVIVLSTSEHESDIKSANQYNVCKYLTKPLLYHDFAEVVASTLGVKDIKHV